MVNRKRCDMRKTDIFQIRLEPEEKEAFKQASEISGLSLSTWARVQLRRAARIELEEAGKKIPFIKQTEVE